MLSDPVAEAFGLIHRHPSGENFWYGIQEQTKTRPTSVRHAQKRDMCKKDEKLFIQTEIISINFIIIGSKKKSL